MKEIYRITERTFPSGEIRFFPEVMVYAHLYDKETGWFTLSSDGETTHENAIEVIKKKESFLKSEVKVHKVIEEDLKIKVNYE
jgi:hypothetical protein